MRINDVEVFGVSLPGRDGVWYRLAQDLTVTRITTDAGVVGMSFIGPDPAEAPRVRSALVGRDLFDFAGHWRAGILQWGGVEHAVWDAIGKITGQPVSRLLGGTVTRLRCYLTCVWDGNPDQSQVSFDDQAAMAVRVRQAGFQGMKIRAWRPNPLDDVEACRVIREAVGPDFALMFDRTAHLPGAVWDYDTALAVAHGLEKHGALWLEEPFSRDDVESPARLSAEVSIAITGGEAYTGLTPFRRCIEARSFDILQPDALHAGGILAVRGVATLAQAWDVRCFLHGYGGPKLAGWLHASAAVNAEWQEIAIVVPPDLPADMWRGAGVLFGRDEIFQFADGDILVPQAPGLGLDPDPDVLERHRVR